MIARNQIIRVSLFLFLFLLTFFPVQGRVVYVDLTASGENDGTSWENAFTTLESGVVASASGDEIWVKAGVYYEDISIKGWTSLYGGFEGTETARDQRDWESNPTIIDATGRNSTVISCGYDGTTIDGFTITGGYVDIPQYYGGGVHYYSVQSATLSHCIISGNGSFLCGGGIYCKGAYPTISHCRISENYAKFIGGGGIFCNGGAPTLIQCEIVGNQANKYNGGGGIYCRWGSCPTLIDCTIANNVADNSRGGGLNIIESNANIISCTISNNSARSGAGICCFGTGFTQITGSVLSYNKGELSGVVHCEHSSLAMNRCTVAGNTTLQGSAFYCGSATTELTNCILRNPGGEISSDSGKYIIQYSCIQGGYPGIGNIDVNPLFENTDEEDYRLQDGSPCIDAGTDTGQGFDFNGAAPDLGAWESPENYQQGQPRDPVIWFVSVAADPGGDGQSWETAFQDITSALNSPFQSGDEIWIAEGVYREALNPMIENCSLFGGFSGDETTRNQRDWAAHPTVIDASGLDASVITNYGVNGTCIDGLTITGGLRGLYFDSVDSATIENCTIAENSFDDSMGGIYCVNSSPTIHRCTIRDNYSKYYGGGLYCLDSSPIITGCTFSGNLASSQGCGLYVKGESLPFLDRCTLAGDRQSTGSKSTVYVYEASATLINCILWNIGNEVCSYLGNLSMQHCCIQGGYPGVGNIDAYPSFVDIENGDYRLQDGSPCIDAGTDTGRQMAYHGSAPDMGSWESPETYSPGEPIQPSIWYVNASALPGGDGKSWETAFQDISSALIWWAVTGDEIWVAGGTYNEALTLLAEDIELYGGFSGNETLRDQRDWVNHPTIIDAVGLDSSAITATCSNNIILDGFVVKNGVYHAGIFFYPINDATVSHCILTENKYGISSRCGSLILSDCTISDNSVVGLSCAWGAYVLSDCTISGNSQAASFYAGAEVVMQYCTIIDNNAESSCLFSNSYSPKFYHCTIAGNSVSGDGSIIECENAPPELINCILWNRGKEIETASGIANVRYSCIQGGYAGEGNIDAEPFFEDLLNSDYRLQNGSPCIDAGTDTGQAFGFNGVAPDMGSWESPENYQPGPPRDPVIWYVNAAADPGGDGRSWETAFQDIESGSIWWSIDGDEVWVAEGEYRQSLSSLAEYSQWYGGFAGSETVRSERDWVAHPTVINASGLGGCVVQANRIRKVLLDGFTITGGEEEGGLVFQSVDEATVRHCQITGNSAQYGGGIYCEDSKLLLSQCTVSENQVGSGDGGAVYCTDNSSLTFDECVVSGNAVNNGDGGAVFCTNQSSVMASCSQFTDNATQKGNGGAFFSEYTSSLEMSNCIIARNEVSGGGGALYQRSSSVTLTNCTVVDNFAESGGGIFSYGDCLLTNCILMNQHEELGGDGDYSVSYCCVQGGWPGEGTISQNPQFVDYSGGDYRLQDQSPAIDRGLLAAAPEKDIEGNSRPGSDGWVDMGAYESADEYLPGSSEPRIFFIRSNAPAGGDGLSWETALNSVQPAFLLASASDEIWMASGTYCETIEWETGVEIYGGFRGDESACDERDWVANPTVIDSSGLGRTLQVRSVNFGIVDGLILKGGGCYFYKSSSCLLRYCTITGSSSSGVYCYQSSPLLKNCTIAGNEGCGFSCTIESAPILTNCLIVGNTGNYGGGFDSSRNSVPPELINCTIAGNHAEERGGVYSDRGGIRIRNSIVWGNYPNNLLEGEYASISCYDCLVEDGVCGENDPLFVDAANCDFHLLPQSPCIDSGNADDEYNDGCLPPGQGTDRNDIGAYGGPGNCVEPPAVPLETIYNGDVNQDGEIDVLDLFLFAVEWGKEPNLDNFYSNPYHGDAVDGKDLVHLLGSWR